MQHKITNVNRRGEWHSKYQRDGEPYNDMVDWAIALEGEEGWIKLSQKVTTKPPQIGDMIEGNVLMEANSKGEPFKKFKKVNPNFTGGRNQSGDTSRLEQRLEYAISLLEKLTGDGAQQSLTEPEDPINLDDLPF